MAPRRTQKYTRSPQRRRRSTQKSGGGSMLYLLLIIAAIGLLLYIMDHPIILLIALLLALGIGAILFWMKYQRYQHLQDLRGQNMPVQQYMNTAHADYQMKQQVLRQNQQQRESAIIQEYERQERERREHARLAAISQLADFRSLSPTEFEKYTGRLLESLGYSNVQHTGQSGDLGADLTATSPLGEHTIVQCKRYGAGNKIVSRDIQTFVGMIFAHHGAQKGIYVTTSIFTTPARNLAQQHPIQLIDGTLLVQLAQQNVLQQRMH